MPLREDNKSMASNEHLDALVAAITGTNRSLEDAELIYARLNGAVRKMRTVLSVALAGLALDLLLSISFGFILHSQSGLNERVNANQVAIHDAECAVNTLFIAVDTPDQRAKTPDKVLYDRFFDQIYETRPKLGCHPAIAKPIRPNP